MNQEEEIKNLLGNSCDYKRLNELAEKQNRTTEILSYLSKAQSMKVERLTKLAKVVKEVEQR